jgi:hypothetical protein
MAPDNICKTIHSHITEFTENFCTLEDKHIEKECAAGETNVISSNSQTGLLTP